MTRMHPSVLPHAREQLGREQAEMEQGSVDEWKEDQWCVGAQVVWDRGMLEESVMME